VQDEAGLKVVVNGPRTMREDGSIEAVIVSIIRKNLCKREERVPGVGCESLHLLSDARGSGERGVRRSMDEI
jgi:hypothetical protein